MGQHTPIPWHQSGNDVAAVDEKPVHVCCGNGINGECCGNPDTDWEPEQVLVAQSSEADAAFIVRACNAHEELVKALEDLLPVAIHSNNGHHPAIQAALVVLNGLKESK